VSALLFSGRGVLVVGVEDDAETGCLRMYVGSRGDGIYALIEDEEAKDELRREWARAFTGHLVVERPPNDVLWTESERP
jgi:hypothetical protein